MGGIGFAVSTPLPIKDLIALAQAAEAQGYESFWITEGTARDAISQLGALAVNTSRIRLGTGIINIYSRTPSLVALTASTLSEISGGRFILGLGAGHKLSIEDNHGMPFRNPVQRMEDYVRIIKTALKERHVSYAGSTVSVPDFRILTPGQEPDPPIYIATLAQRMGQLAGRLADGALPHMATPQGVQEVAANVREGAKAAGRDPSEVDIACFIIACASNDDGAPEAEARRHIARYAAMPLYQNMLRRGGYGEEADTMARDWASGNGEAAARSVSDAMLEELTLAGHPANWQRTISRYRAAGATQMILYGCPAGANATDSLMETLTAGAP